MKQPNTVLVTPDGWGGGDIATERRVRTLLRGDLAGSVAGLEQCDTLVRCDDGLYEYDLHRRHDQAFEPPTQWKADSTRFRLVHAGGGWYTLEAI